jgi:hypothetical protein
LRGRAGRAAAAAPRFADVRDLDLSRNDLGDDGVRVFTGATVRWPVLTDPDLRRNGLNSTA